MMFKRRYQLVKLRAETVEELKRLKYQMGKASIDGLIVSMINSTDAKRLKMMNHGWQTRPGGKFVGN
jgi:hypothetical protein